MSIENLLKIVDQQAEMYYRSLHADVLYLRRKENKFLKFIRDNKFVDLTRSPVYEDLKRTRARLKQYRSAERGWIRDAQERCHHPTTKKKFVFKNRIKAMDVGYSLGPTATAFDRINYKQKTVCTFCGKVIK